LRRFIFNGHNRAWAKVVQKSTARIPASDRVQRGRAAIPDAAVVPCFLPSPFASGKRLLFAARGSEADA